MQTTNPKTIVTRS